MRLGLFIATRRKNMRMTQDELAQKMNVSKSAIAKWETDGGIPDRDNLKRLAEIFGITVDELYRIIDGEEKNYPLDANITSDVISVLESYGYKVIRPEKKRED